MTKVVAATPGKVTRPKLVSFCDKLLDAATCRDYCPNGLQLEGKREISYIISGVTASQALIQRAAREQADALLVHHGYFWKGESPCLVGMKQRRIKALLAAEINLLAYHLPLDMHKELGNNAYIGSLLGVDLAELEVLLPQEKLGFIATLPQTPTASELAKLLRAKFGQSPLHLRGIAKTKPIKRVAWCSGAAQNFIDQAKAKGADAYISGEVSEQTFHFVRENNIDYFAVGHHNSEVGGVQLLGARLAEEFGIKHKFINLANPI